MQNREHNYVADQLASRYPEEFPNDEALYQQARLVMNQVYVSVIVRDYIGGITGMQITFS